MARRASSLSPGEQRLRGRANGAIRSEAAKHGLGLGGARRGVVFGCNGSRRLQGRSVGLGPAKTCAGETHGYRSR